MEQKIFCVLLWTILATAVKQYQAQDGYVSFHNIVRFPYGGPFMGLFLAVAIPLELQQSNVFLSYNFEANYNLPDNQTFYEYPPIVSDRFLEISRRRAYDALEYKLELHGYPGKKCLLRAICEIAEYSLINNGVLGDIIHILLTPSSSKFENKLSGYRAAENYGKINKHCKKYASSCSVSFIDLISWIDNFL